MDITFFTVKFRKPRLNQLLQGKKTTLLKYDEENKAESEEDVDELTDLNIMESIMLISIILRTHGCFLKTFNKCL